VGKNGAVVLGAEAIAEDQGFGFAVFQVGTDDDEEHDNKHKRAHNELGIR
jgi:hypothetical protein